jgi:hypothetical protein
MTSTADITTNSNAAILELNSSNVAEGMLTMTTAPMRQINALAIGVSFDAASPTDKVPCDTTIEGCFASCASELDMDDTAANTDRDGLRSILRAELVHDVLDVDLHGCAASAVTRVWCATALLPMARVSDPGGLLIHLDVEHIGHSGDDQPVHHQGDCEGCEFRRDLRNHDCLQAKVSVFFVSMAWPIAQDWWGALFGCSGIDVPGHATRRIQVQPMWVALKGA